MYGLTEFGRAEGPEWFEVVVLSFDVSLNVLNGWVGVRVGEGEKEEEGEAHDLVVFVW